MQLKFLFANAVYRSDASLIHLCSITCHNNIIFIKTSFVQNKQREYQDVTEKLKTLRGLAEEDISEVGLLKCRIEQQAELICILKQRADEYLKKYMEIEDKTGIYVLCHIKQARKYWGVWAVLGLWLGLGLGLHPPQCCI